MTSTGLDLVLPWFQHAPLIQTLLCDSTVSDLMINESSVFVDRLGTLSPVPDVALNKEYLQNAIENIARQLGHDVNEDYPILDTRLSDGSRVGVLWEPLTITIRRFNRWFSTDELVQSGSLPGPVRDSLIAAIRDRKNVLVSGGTGSGKTTLVSALIRHIPTDERLIVIEKPRELDIATHPNCVRWEARDAIKGRVPISTKQLLKAALRHRPDRIIIGEVRDEDAWDLLQAMNTGHSGTLSTTHADNAADALFRISDMATSALPNVRQDYVRTQTARAIHFVVHAERIRGKHRITELLHVDGYDTDQHRFLTTEVAA